MRRSASKSTSNSSCCCCTSRNLRPIGRGREKAERSSGADGADYLLPDLGEIHSSPLDEGATSLVTAALQIQGVAFSLFVTTTLIFALVFVFGLITAAIGGASFNPTATAAFYAAGLGSDNLLSMALRFPAQAAGAVAGALAIMEVMPPQHKRMLGGPSLKVDLHTGALAEGVLTFIITLAVLWIIIRGPRSPVVKTWMVAVSTVAMVVAGAGYTGPAMNPANAFGWAYINNRHNTWEQFYVYWICPFIGAIVAGWFFRIIFPQRAEKAKKA